MEPSFFLAEEHVPFRPLQLNDLNRKAETEVMPPQSEPDLPTLAEIEAMHEQARQEGYAQGYAEGQQEVRSLAQRLASAAQQLDDGLAQLHTSIADQIVALARAIAQNVVRQELGVRPEIVTTVVHEALHQIPHGHATIHLNPEDVEVVRQQAGDHLTQGGHRLVADAAITRGGCRVSCGASTVDATIETRWERVTGEIFKRVAEPPAS